MRVILVNPRGFCAGVHMAIDVVDQLLELCPDEAIYVYHEIVHNRHIVSRFIEQGVTFVESLDDVPHGSVVVFSAHGVSPLVRELAERRDLTAIDATCPLVTKVHMEAIRYAKQGYRILLIGHAEHQEIIGTRGQAPDSMTVVESPEDVGTLHFTQDTKLAYLTQTTLSTDDAELVIQAIRARFPWVKEPPQNDICYATTNRQGAVRMIAPGCDLCLVVGSHNSSNSVRLTEISEAAGCPAQLIDDASELDPQWLIGKERVLITAGASAPEDLVAQLVRDLVTNHDAQIEVSDITDEDIEFDIPITLKRMMRQRDVDPADRRIHITRPTITEDLYGSTPLTISVGALPGQAS
jgi:4-hydroxy-3-methylbut-2-enyl diphosphate reductase